MKACEDVRARFPDVLTSGTAAEKRALEKHLARCSACSEELRAMEETWSSLPDAGMLRAPAGLRARIVEQARRAVEAGAGQRSGVPDRVWNAARGFAAPVGLGVAAALAVLSLLRLRGAAADLTAMEAVLTSLVLAGLLATAAGAVLRSRSAREVRGVFSGALGSTGGYVVLTLLSPIPETVDFCRVTLLGDPALGLTQLCLVYLGVASLYAGAPMAVAAYLSPKKRWTTGVLEGALFALLAAPVAVLQFGTAEWMITGTGLLGLVLGAVLGGAAGSWIRGWRIVPAR